MAKFYDQLNQQLKTFIAEQKIFFPEIQVAVRTGDQFITQGAGQLSGD